LVHYRLVSGRTRWGRKACALRTAQPVGVLKGFQGIALAPGETKKVTVQVERDAFAIWNDRIQFAASGSDAKLDILP
jgi:hypothetical protein